MTIKQANEAIARAAALTEANNTLTAELATANKRATEAEAKVETLTAELATANKRATEAEAKVANLTEASEKLTADLLAANKRADEMSGLAAKAAVDNVRLIAAKAQEITASQGQPPVPAAASNTNAAPSGVLSQFESMPEGREKNEFLRTHAGSLLAEYRRRELGR